ncbi:MAG: hypothetical protein RMI94_10535 [Bryobacterales bacterium]|nr:hypothetical protein [Bryobacteraceae bacterium]MDW8130976.1 hypothetical protein [Bryobacterales bacterium]
MDTLVRSNCALGEACGPGLSRAGVGTGETNVHTATFGYTGILEPTFALAAELEPRKSRRQPGG